MKEKEAIALYENNFWEPLSFKERVRLELLILMKKKADEEKEKKEK